MDYQIDTTKSISGKRHTSDALSFTPKKAEQYLDLSNPESSPVLESVFLSNKNSKRLASSTPATDLLFADNCREETKPNLVLNALDRLCSPIRKDSSKNLANKNTNTVKNVSVKRLFSDSEGDEDGPFCHHSKKKKQFNDNEKTKSDNLPANETYDPFYEHGISDTTLQVLCEATNHSFINLETEKPVSDQCHGGSELEEDTIKIHSTGIHSVSEVSCTVLKNKVASGNEYVNKNESVTPYQEKSCHLNPTNTPFIYSVASLERNVNKNITLNELLLNVKYLEDANKFDTLKSNNNKNVLLSNNQPCVPAKLNSDDEIVHDPKGVETHLEGGSNEYEPLDDSVHITDTQFHEAVDAAEILTELDQTINNFTCSINLLRGTEHTNYYGDINVSKTEETCNSECSSKNNTVLLNSENINNEIISKDMQTSRINICENEYRVNSVLTKETMNEECGQFLDEDTTILLKVPAEAKIDKDMMVSKNELLNLKTGGGAKLQESEERLEKARQMFIGIEDLEELPYHNDYSKINKVCTDMETSSQYKGFQTANGKAIEISVESFNKAKQSLDDEFNLCEIQTVDAEDEQLKFALPVGRPKLDVCGFKTGRGRIIEVTEESMKKAKQKLNEDFELDKCDSVVKSISLLNEMKNVLKNENELVNQRHHDDSYVVTLAHSIDRNKYNENIKESGHIDFQRVRSVVIQKSNKLINKTRQTLDNEQNLCENPPINAIKNCSLKIDQSLKEVEGFQTANGKAVKISQEMIKRARQRLSDVFELDSNETIEQSHKLLNKARNELNYNSKLMNSKSQEPGGSTGKHGCNTLSVKDEANINENSNINFPHKGFHTDDRKVDESTDETLNKPRLKFDNETNLCKISNVDAANEHLITHQTAEETIGYQTVSGRSVKVSEKMLMNARQKVSRPSEFELDKIKILQSQKSLNEIKDEFNHNEEENVKVNGSTNVLHKGFQTAGGKVVEISEESLNKAHMKIHNEPNPFKVPIVNTNFKTHQSDVELKGFQTARGRRVKISEEMLNKARHKLSSEFELNDIEVLRSQKSLNKIENDFTYNDELMDLKCYTARDPSKQGLNTSSIKDEENIKGNSSFDLHKGFQTAGGKVVEISEASLNKARMKLDTELNLEEPSNKDDENVKVNISTNLLHKGFQTAGGKVVEISKESLNKAWLKLDNELNLEEPSIKDEENVKANISTNLFHKGFQTAGGKVVEISKASLNKARMKLDNEINLEEPSIKDDENVKVNISTNLLHKGFQTAGGKVVEISEASLNKARMKLDNEINLEEPSIKDGENVKVNISTNLLHKGFQTAGGKVVKISEASLNNARIKLDNELNLEEPLVNESFIAHQSVMEIKGFQTASGRAVKVSKETLMKARQNLNDEFELGLHTNDAINQLRKPINKVRDERASGRPNHKLKTSSMKDKENMKVNSSANFLHKGFQTAGGKVVEISEESLNKARFKLDNELNLYEEPLVKENFKTHKSVTEIKGFQTASGRAVEVSAEMLKKARDKLTDEFNLETVEIQSLKSLENEFSYSDKLVDLKSNDGRDKTKQGHNASNNRDTANTKESRSTNLLLKGFQTASGRVVEISEESLNKADNDFHICEMSPVRSVSEQLNCTSMTGQSKLEMKGFQTAGGGSIRISEESLTKARQLLNDDFESNTSNESSIKAKDTLASDGELLSPKPLNGETYDNISDIPVVKRSKMVCENTDQLYNKEKDFNQCIKQSKVSHKPCKKVKPLFDNDDKPLNAYQDSTNKIMLVDDKLINKRLKDCTDVSLQSNRTMYEKECNNREFCNKMKINFQPPTNYLNTHFSVISEDDLSLLNQSLMTQGNLSFASVNETQINDTEELTHLSPGSAREVSESMAALMADEASSSPFVLKPFLTSPSMIFDRQLKLPTFNCDESDMSVNDKQLSPVLDTYSRYKPVSLIKKSIRDSLDGKCNEKDTTPQAKSNSFRAPYATSTPHEIVKKTRPKRLFEGSHNSFPFSKREKIQNDDTTVKKIAKEDISKARKKAADEQELTILSKKGLVKPCKGSLLLKKQTEKRIKLQDLGESSLQLPTEKQLRSFGIKTSIVEMSASKALDFKFVARDYYSEETSNTNVDGIPVGDGASIILDEENKAGVEEIARGFLASPAVDPVLISKDWIKNHFRWIVLKMAAMERMFPKQLGNRYLTPNYVMLQLKYRYDLEIDRCQRSAVRKILEKDESPAKTMVLFVADIVDITQNGSREKKELELSDGWYSMKATVDHEMEVLIIRKKVAIGTKLLITGADLVNNNDGCHPLETPPNVRLKVATNSCRRVRWYTRLGFCGSSFPPVRLQGILGQGGTIPALSAVVARAYPPLFLEKLLEGKSVVRGERAEQAAADLHLTKRQQTAETILSQLQQDLEKSKCNKRQPVATGSIRNAESERELLLLLEGVDDFSLYQDVLSREQISLLEQYKQEEASRVQQQLQTKLVKSLDEKLPPRNVTKMAKIRLSSLENECSALLTVWNPSDDLLSLLAEGNALTIHNVSASGFSRFRDLQLTAGRNTRYSLVKHCQLHRRSTSLEELHGADFKPQFSEIDVVGVVLPAVDNSFEDNSKLIYIADSSYNFLGISFSTSLKDTGYTNMVSPGSHVAATSLHWRSNVVSWGLPTAFATELSAFSQHPRQQHLQQALRQLRDDTSTLDLTVFMDECVVRLKNLIAIRNSGGSKSSTTPVTAQNIKASAVTDSVANQVDQGLASGSKVIATDSSEHCDSPVNRRLSLLERFREPPPISPLLLTTPSRLKRSFRPPMKKQTENR